MAVTLLSLLTGQPAGAKDWEGRVTAIVDGDTFMLRRGEESQRVRLMGVDAPEEGQPFYEEAKRHLIRLLLSRKVRVVIGGDDGLGTTLGRVTVDGEDARGEDPRINEYLLRLGMAWSRPDWEGTNDEFDMLMQKARRDKIGLWAQPSPTPPWEFLEKRSPGLGRTRSKYAGPGYVKHSLSQLELANSEQAQGDALVQEGQYARAIGHYKASLGHVQSPEVYALLGDALSLSGDLAGAVASYREGVSRAQAQEHSSLQRGDIQFRFAILLARAGSGAEAVQMYESGVAALIGSFKEVLPRTFSAPSIQPGSPAARRLEASALVGLVLVKGIVGEPDRALSLCQKALESDPDCAPAHFLIGETLSIAGKAKREEVRAHFEKAATLGRGAVRRLAQERLSRR